MELKLVLPLPTSINKLYINEYQWTYDKKTRRKVRKPTGRRILSQEGRKVKAMIQGEARVQLEQQKDKWDYEWTKTNFCYQDAKIVFTRRGSDDNNIYKLLNDSLEKIVYDNDSRVLVRTQHIVYNPKNPRVELTLTPVEFVGIFPTVGEAVDFERQCIGCSRYKDGRCTILQDVMRGTEREEVDEDFICSAFKQKKS